MMTMTPTDKRIQMWLLSSLMAGAAALPGCNDSVNEAASCSYGDDDPRCPAPDELNDEGLDETGDDSPARRNCGDGHVDPDEECDDGNNIDDDECTNVCTLPTCGDGVLHADLGEECDDGGTLPGDLCTAGCRLPGTRLGEHVIDEFRAAPSVVIDSRGDVVVMLTLGGKRELVKFSRELVPRWNTQIISGEFDNVALGPDDALLVAGRSQFRATTQEISPHGDMVWMSSINKWLSTGFAAASAEGYTVSTGYSDVGNNIGVLVRHNHQTGQVQKEIGEVGGLGHVEVDAFGTVWTIGRAKQPRLRIYDAKSNIQRTVELEPGYYEDLVVDADKSVFGLARDWNGEPSFTIFKQGPDGNPAWKGVIRYEGGIARGMALLPGGTMVVAGQTDHGQALLVWFDQVSGEQLHEVVIDSESAFEEFMDIAAAPSGDYAVAVGRRGKDLLDTRAWIYLFET